MSDFPGLWRMEGVKGGQPCIRDTGVLVWFVASRFTAGDSIVELAADYRVSEEAIVQCIRLVLSGAYGQRGLSADVERRMNAELPLETRLAEKC